MVSGGFDPLHIGHLQLIQAARTYGQVVVALNSDDWLMRKKGYVFMPWDERAAILQAISCVTIVLPVDDTDGTVCKLLVSVHPHYFANGGDRISANVAEDAVCKVQGIKQLFNVGGGKIRSSSSLVAAAHSANVL